MAITYDLKVCTPVKELFSGSVTEVILPGMDGENGVLAQHKNLIGLLGTGVLKLVTDGDDYWYMVSSGVFGLNGGVMTVLAEVAEVANEIDIEAAKSRAQELAPKVSSANTYLSEFDELKVEYDRVNARIEAYRRTHLVN